MECDAKSVNALDHIIKKWKMDYIPLPIKLVHSDIVTTDDAPTNYEQRHRFNLKSKSNNQKRHSATLIALISVLPLLVFLGYHSHHHSALGVTVVSTLNHNNNNNAQTVVVHHQHHQHIQFYVSYYDAIHKIVKTVVVQQKQAQTVVNSCPAYAPILLANGQCSAAVTTVVPQVIVSPLIIGHVHGFLGGFHFRHR